MPPLQNAQVRHCCSRRAVLLPVPAAPVSSLPRHAAHVNEATTSPHRRAADPGRVGPGAASGERHMLLPLHARGPIAVSVLCHVSRGAVRGMRGPGAGARGPRAVGGGDEREERLQPP